MKRRKLTKESLIEIAKGFSTRGDFQHGDKSAYLSAYTKGWLDEVCTHMEAVRRTHTKESVAAIARLYATRAEFALSDNPAYSAARENDWLDEICCHMETKHRTLDKETIAESAKRFSTRGEFEMADSYAHRIASRHGWLDEVCAHMMPCFRTHTKESLKTIAKTFNSRAEFQRGDSGAYRAAFSRGWLDEICSHMTTAITGFDSAKPGYLYQVKFTMPNGENIWKIGITNISPKHRLRELAAPKWVRSEITSVVRYESGIDARCEEKRLHDFGRSKGLSYDGDIFLKSGHTELFFEPLI
jgi:hypothetical protein